MVREIVVGAAGVVLVLVAAAPVQAQCKSVSGIFTEHVLNGSQGDRVLGTVDGTLKGVTTATVTSLVPDRDGSLRVTTDNVFATTDGGQVYMRGEGLWEFIKRDFYHVELTLTILRGTGKYRGAYDTITTVGVGNRVESEDGQFLQEYRGLLCT